MRRWGWLFAGCYALSGAAALVYQVVWTRMFALELGHTVAASSTVLAAFMGGLGAGAWLSARLLPTSWHRLRVYAVLEIGIAAAAIALPSALLLLRPLLVWTYANATAPAWFGLTRFVLSLVLLGVPASLMGATFPVAAGWIAGFNAHRSSPGHSRAAADVAFAYAANTAGAAVGAIASGFWLIPAFGLRAATWSGVILNTVAAGVAWRIAREPSARSDDGRRAPIAKPRRKRDDSRRTELVRPRLAYAVAALSGCSALVYEVAWTRLLALVIGPTTYAFATMAAAFVIGIAIGSALSARWSRRMRRPALWLAAALLVTSSCAVTAAWFTASRLPLSVAHQLAAGEGGGSVLVREAVTVLIVLLPVGLALGVTFTLALATASPTLIDVESKAARLYLANTTGAVAGALAAGFVLIDRDGLQGTIAGMSRISALAAVAVAAYVIAADHSATKRIRLAVVSGAVVTAAAIAWIPLHGWDRMLLASGAYKYGQKLGADELESRLHTGTLEYYREGAAATVSVRRFAGSRSLSVDGKVDASDAADMLTQRLLGVLPILLHSSPERLLVIGLGSGVTLQSALASGAVERADVVEISPEVVEASAFFAAENHSALKAPGVRLVMGDGRSHLMLTTQQYDVIVSEPSNPWMAGVASLFTREFFEAARARLRPGGLLCQWAHTYEMDEADLASIVATFAAVFPQGTMWLSGESDLLLVGALDGDIESRVAQLADRTRLGALPAMWVTLGMGSSAPFVLLSQFIGGPAALRAFGAGARLQTDDRTTLEYTAPQAMYSRTPNDNRRRLQSVAAGVHLPDVVSEAIRTAGTREWTARGTTAMGAEAYSIAYESFQRAVTLDPDNADALHGAVDASLRAGNADDVRAWLIRLAGEHPANAPVRIELAHVLAASGSAKPAIDAALEAAQILPGSPLPIEQLASIYEDLGDGEHLTAMGDELTSRFPDRESGPYYRAAALFLRGRAVAAIDAVRPLIAADPMHAKAHNLLGVACADAGRMDCAREAFETAVRLSPRDASSYLNLGVLHLRSADATAAAAYFADALALDIESAPAREGLAQARAAGASR